jgi:hypothetical protein
LIKTFWTGPGGWADQQLPDGTILITTPAGLSYPTKPASALYFPGWNTTTTPPPTPTATKTSYSSGLSMPKRKRTPNPRPQLPHRGRTRTQRRPHRRKRGTPALLGVSAHAKCRVPHRSSAGGRARCGPPTGS